MRCCAAPPPPSSCRWPRRRSRWPALRASSGSGARVRVPLLILLAPLAAGVFNFVNTPMVRYQGAMMWVLGADFAVLALAPLGGKAGRLLRTLCVVAVVAVCAVSVERLDERWIPL